MERAKPATKTSPVRAWLDACTLLLCYRLYAFNILTSNPWGAFFTGSEWETDTDEEEDAPLFKPVIRTRSLALSLTWFSTMRVYMETCGPDLISCNLRQVFVTKTQRTTQLSYEDQEAKEVEAAAVHEAKLQDKKQKSRQLMAEQMQEALNAENNALLGENDIDVQYCVIACRSQVYSYTNIQLCFRLLFIYFVCVGSSRTMLTSPDLAVVLWHCFPLVAFSYASFSSQCIPPYACRKLLDVLFKLMQLCATMGCRMTTTTSTRRKSSSRGKCAS